jgi:DNA repair protein RadA/Sms
MKSQTIFVCTKCDSQFPKWSGRCLSCGAWNSLTEQQSAVIGKSAGARPVKTSTLASVDISFSRRLPTGQSELDLILGGEDGNFGLVPGSLVLLGGDPGIGKSTLALQAALYLANQSLAVLYVSGEESLPQIKLRAQRISPNLEKLQVLSESNLDAVLATVEAQKPKVLVIDSVQTMYSDIASGVAGGVAQVSYATARILECIKRLNTVTFIIGHVTKEGNLAGPKMLEHMVDVVLYLEGERDQAFRILRCIKNRFGATSEVGVFEMKEAGLAEVSDPSRLFLAGRVTKHPGNAVTCTLEGTRALLLEIQALCVKSQFNYPKRTSTGFDLNRLLLLAAVLQKNLGLKLFEQDIFVSVAGGYKISEPACDLAVALAIYSSLKDLPVSDDICAVGEVGLSGEIRGVSRVEKRINEAAKLGFGRIIIPQIGHQVSSSKIKILPVSDLKQATGFLIGR